MVVLWHNNKYGMQIQGVNKVIVQGILILASFLLLWFLLAKVNWVGILKVEQVTRQTEEKLGDIFWEVFKNTDTEVEDSDIVGAVDSLVSHICAANELDRSTIKVHVLSNDQVNAFALPDGHLIITTSIIRQSDSQEELAGIISHEIAHIELNHITRKLIKEIGLSVLIGMTTGQTGADVISETARKLSSLAFDRNLEREADIKAIEYLMNARVNPAGLADFMYKMGQQEEDTNQILSWLSTHPAPSERASYILEKIEDEAIMYEQILSKQTWSRVQELLSEN